MLKEKTNLLIGKNGSGKTTGILLKEMGELINNNENILVFDNKEEYYQTYGKLLKENDYNVYVFNLKNAKKSNGFNPLSLPYYYYKNNESSAMIKLITDLGLNIFKSNNPNNDPFWENMASDYFTSLTLTLFEEGNENEINIGSVANILAKGTKQDGNGGIFSDYLKSLDPLNTIYITGSGTEFAPYETKLSILSVMRQKLNLFLMREDLLNVLNTNDLEINKLKDKCAIFIIGDYDLNNLANTLIDQIFTYIKYTKIKFNFILDNFDSLPLLSNIREMINDASYYNLKLYLAIRDLNEMENMYGKYVFNHMANIINVNNIHEFMTVGSYDEYPTLEKKNIKYFDVNKLRR